MHLKCPNCGSPEKQSHPTSVDDPETAAEIKAGEFLVYDGVESTNGVIDDGDPAAELRIDQSSHQTPNYFTHRKVYEKRTNTTVRDCSDDIVRVVFHSGWKSVTALKCTNCNCVYHRFVGELQ